MKKYRKKHHKHHTAMCTMCQKQITLIIFTLDINKMYSCSMWWKINSLKR